jgi:hypothetical protein
VAPVRTNVSEKAITSIIRVEKIGELETYAVRVLPTLMMGKIRSSETSVLRKVTRSHIPEDFILQK